MKTHKAHSDGTFLPPTKRGHFADNVKIPLNHYIDGKASISILGRMTLLRLVARLIEEIKTLRAERKAK
jgi:hypothetical protein